MKDLSGNRVNLKTLKRYNIVYKSGTILVYAGKVKSINKSSIRLYEIVYDIYRNKIDYSGIHFPNSVVKYKNLNKRLFWGYVGIEQNMILEHCNNIRPTLKYIVKKYKSLKIEDYEK